MSDKRTRNGKRFNAAYLWEAIQEKRANEHICPECGEKGAFHWIATSLLSLEDFCLGRVPNGFWVCPKFYDPVTKRRIAP